MDLRKLMSSSEVLFRIGTVFKRNGRNIFREKKTLNMGSNFGTVQGRELVSGIFVTQNVDDIFPVSLVIGDSHQVSSLSHVESDKVIDAKGSLEENLGRIQMQKPLRCSHVEEDGTRIKFATVFGKMDLGEGILSRGGLVTNNNVIIAIKELDYEQMVFEDPLDRMMCNWTIDFL